MARDTKRGSPLAIFCIPTHFVGDTFSGATPGVSKQLPVFPHKVWGLNHRPQRWEVSILTITPPSPPCLLGYNFANFKDCHCLDSSTLEDIHKFCAM